MGAYLLGIDMTKSNPDTKESPTQGSMTFALGISALAVVLRLIYLIEWSNDPGFTALMVDEKWHWLWAGDILEKSFWGDGAWFRGPLYPYLLALIRFVTDGSVFWSKALQLGLSGLTCFFTIRLTQFLFGNKAGVLAGVMYALYGTLVFYDSMFLVEALFWPLCVCGVYRFVVYCESGRWQTWALTGCIFGLAALTRPNVLLVAPILCLWLMWQNRAVGSIVGALRLPAIFGISLVLSIMPATIRNYLVTGEVILISSQGGVNFYIGNNPSANGLTMLIPEVQLDESVAWDQFIPVTNAAAVKEAGRSLSDGEISDFWTKKTLKWISDNTGSFIDLVGKKLAYLVSGFENSDNGDIYFHRQKSALYAFLLWAKGIFVPWGLLFPLSVMGMVFSWQDRNRLAPIYIFVIAYIPTIILFLVTARHRLVLVPFMMVFAASGIAIGWDKRKRISFRQWVAIAFGFGLLLIFSNRVYFEAGRGADFQNYYNEGLRLMAVKDFVAAEKEFERAHDSWPHSAVVLNNLGYVQFMQGKDSAAVANYDKSMRVDTAYYQPYNNLGLAMARKGFLDSAKALFIAAKARIRPEIERVDDVSQVYINLGEAYMKSGEIESGKRQFDTAIAIVGGDVRTVARIATTCSQLKQYAFADTLFQFASQSDQMIASEWFNWGVMRLEWQKWKDAEYPLTRCLEVDPQTAPAWYCLAFAKLQLGEPKDKVIGLLDRALLINPQYQQALNLKNQVESGR